MTEPTSFNPCAVIPVYNHFEQLPDIIDSLQSLGLHCILVNDGSDSTTSNALTTFVDSSNDTSLFHLSWNQGKGAAVMDGLMRAQAAGYTHALQIDADGQHDVKALPALLESAKNNPDTVISGSPVYDSSVPKSRLYGRKITQFWVCVETLSNNITDAMVGFRIYPLSAVCPLITTIDISRRMDFDIEIMVRLDWANVAIKTVPVPIVYPEGGVSHFDTVKDNIRISLLHTRLFFGMLRRFPSLLQRRLNNGQKADSHHWSDIQERGAITGIRLLLAIYRLLGHKVFSVMLLPVMAYFFMTGRRARQASQDYLAKLYTAAPDTFHSKPAMGDSFRHFISFGHSLADRFAAWSGDIPLDRLEIRGQTLLSSHLSHGKGVILLVSHLGNIELCRALADLPESKIQAPVNVLVHTQHAPAFNQVMQEVNPNANIRLIQVGSIGPDTAIMLSELLEQGEIVAIAADRLPKRADDSASICASFLGHEARFPKGPFIISALLKSPVFTVFCTRKNDDSSYLLDINLFADPLQLPRHSRNEHLEAYAQQYADRLAATCQRSPMEWFNFFDFWDQR